MKLDLVNYLPLFTNLMKEEVKITGLFYKQYSRSITTPMSFDPNVIIILCVQSLN